MMLTAAISHQAVMYRSLHMHGGAGYTVHRLLSSSNRAFRCAPAVLLLHESMFKTMAFLTQ